MAHHPSENFIKYLILKDPENSDDDILKVLDDWAILPPRLEDSSYIPFLRQRLEDRPASFDPLNKLDRHSMNFLRRHGVYYFFYPNEGAKEAWEILADPQKRIAAEQVLLARLPRKSAAQKLNQKNRWFLTEEGLDYFHDFFWNVRLLTWDEWGRYLFGRTQMYEKYLTLLRASPELSFFHLQFEQHVESKFMIKRTQEIAYFTLEEVNLKPGAGPDKVKAIGVLSKAITECHEALSTSDMALKDILKNFERFRMEHPLTPPKDIKALAPNGNFTGSGEEAKEKIKIIKTNPDNI